MAVENLNLIFSTALSIIASLGGGGVIVIACSSWLGKIWANRIFEDERARHQKDIENLKSELSKELGRISKIQDKALHISKSQYDNEYRIYKEVWGKMYDCIILSEKLYPKMEYSEKDPDREKQRQIDKYKKYIKAFNEYSTIVDKNVIFYNKDFYDCFIEIRNLCSDIGTLFSLYKLENIELPKDKRDWIIIFPNEIDALRKKLQEDIREYLLNLQLKE